MFDVDSLFSLDNANQGQDSELDKVWGRLKELDPDGSRFAAAIRRTFDMLLDGPNTGRYKWEQLYKTEKTHCGTLVEINLQREFAFESGEDLDYRIAGHEVDCKYSQKLGEWMVPPEALDKILLGVWASDFEGQWSAGLVRAKEKDLSAGVNRDGKKRLSKQGKAGVRWLFERSPLPPNALLHLPEVDVAAIFAARSGQARLNELVTRAQGIVLTRQVICTVATAGGKPITDPLRRLRGGGEGARGQLRQRGIIVMGDYENHRAIARRLGLPVPGASEFVSVRLVRRKPHHAERPSVVLDGAEWVRADRFETEEVVPALPDVRRTRRSRETQNVRGDG